VEKPSLTRPSEVRSILDALDLKPSRVLGQNFLIDQNILKLMVNRAELQPSDHVLEIGPGLGVLTEALLQHNVQVTAVEKDALLCRYLHERFDGQARFTLIEGDALDVDLKSIVAGGANKLISNLPYSVGNRILVDVVAEAVIPELMLVMVQRDVARRMVAKPGSKTYGLLTLLIQNDYEILIEKHVSPNCFLPTPQIWSSIVRFTRRPVPLVVLNNAAVFRGLLKWAFSKRRKQMSTVLRNPPYIFLDGLDGLGVLAKLAIDPKERPEDLTVVQWGEIANRMTL